MTLPESFRDSAGDLWKHLGGDEYICFLADRDEELSAEEYLEAHGGRAECCIGLYLGIEKHWGPLTGVEPPQPGDTVPVMGKEYEVLTVDPDGQLHLAPKKTELHDGRGGTFRVEKSNSMADSVFFRWDRDGGYLATHMEREQAEALLDALEEVL